MGVERLRFTNQENNEKKAQLGEFLEHISNRNKNNTINNVLSVSNKLGFINQSEQFEDRIVASKNLSNYKIVQKYDFAYNPARINVGSIARLENFESGIVSPMYIVFRTSEKLNSDYLKFFLDTQSFYDQMTKYLVGSVRQTLDFKSLLKIKIKAKNLAEQEKIGNFLSLFDRLIEKLGTKVRLLKEFKKGYLQQMFPAKGEKVPKIRFAGFDEEWESKKYHDVLIERREIAPESAKYPLMSFIAEHGVVKKSDRYNREFLVKDEYKKYKRTIFGDFIYSSNNLTTGSIGLNNFGDASISPVYSIFLTKPYNYYQFMGEYLTLKYNIFKMLRYRQGVVYGQYRIPESDFLNIKSRFPNFSEQQKIGNFFKSLDEMIEKHEIEMNAIEELKKGYMQRLFA